MFKKLIRKMVITLGLGLLILVLGTFLFLNMSPEFGGKQTAEQEKKFALTSHYKDGKFINNGNIDLKMGFKDFGKSLVQYFNAPKGTIPDHPLQVETIKPSDLMNYTGKTRLFWFGHSTFLLQINSKNILIDPMFGDVPAPHPMLGSKRFSDRLPINIDNLPHIDAVLISHDHYDHLDYGSITKLKEKVGAFYTPLGVGAHLESWGVPKNKIHELDWWEEITFTDLKFVCTPAQHFSGRGLSDKGKTLWSSWIINSEQENIFFSGDSGYGPHFKDIGEKYGPFDFAMIECGQYNTLWHEIHMYPEETAQAAIDVKAKRMMPIHWGAFKLAMHEWDEPVERLENAAQILNVNMITPKIGELITIDDGNNTLDNWWK
ncbi:MBL fold metallo-hydrolase [Formosa sp. PL04]|uniref:MBL fold metallo-hydrolase n=1 Tax=Formosa sp. PL04 TaxID=3081755 RepID=UPI002980DA5A|nr:MBL fold metallo-hydrolase [Formosa sp. PL04]MDW5288489.1 MBL fold metallo-hydrolase [Formosa sp. PL04]